MTPTTRRIAIALAVSAALNLFLGGFIAARPWAATVATIALTVTARSSVRERSCAAEIPKSSRP